MCQRGFHAVDSFYHDVFKRTGRHVQNSSQWKPCKFVAHSFPDVSKQVECRDMTHARRNCMKQNIPQPKNSNNSTLGQKELPVAYAGKKLLNNPCNHKIRCYTARHTQKGKEHAYDVLYLFFTCKINYPAEESFFCSFFLR